MKTNLTSVHRRKSIGRILLGLIGINLLVLAWLSAPRMVKYFSLPLTPNSTQTSIVQTLPSNDSTATAYPNEIASQPSATQPALTTTSIPLMLSSPTTTPTLVPVATSTALPPVILDASARQSFQQQGAIILSMADGLYNHLFAYNPQYYPMTRLTNDAWDDIQPAISPDGTRIAFSSHASGFWDIYILDLASGNKTRLTNTPDYDGMPTWSPDGEWLSYESYRNNNLDIFIQSTKDPSQIPVQLTNNPSADSQPAWSPKGRSIAFVTNRSGREEIWIASLDQADNRSNVLISSPTTRNTHPSWSPDGRYLAWTSEGDGMRRIVVAEAKNVSGQQYNTGTGEYPAWGPASDTLLSVVNSPNQQRLLSAYQITNNTLAFPPTVLMGTVYGIDWKAGKLANLLTVYPVAKDARNLNTPLWQSVISVSPPPPNGRFGVVQLSGVTAPYPYLHDTVNESFDSLRQAIASMVGWDFLANLENAYTPITNPSAPEMEDNWLYTGRAIAINSTPLNAKWMALVREEDGGQTYWRLYLKTRFQDGSQGLPMTSPTWNLDSRFTGDPRIYEQGGKPDANPEGYWVDFTEMAARYGWKRLPALINWRTYYPGTRFNLFVLTDKQDWKTAMDELYPIEVLNSLHAYTTLP